MRYELSDYEWTVIKPMLPKRSERDQLSIRPRSPVTWLERVNRQRAKPHGCNDRESAVEGCRLDASAGSTRKRARVKVQTGFRR